MGTQERKKLALILFTLMRLRLWHWAKYIGLMTESQHSRPAATAHPQCLRSKTANDPTHRVNGNTARGRRLRELYSGFLQHTGSHPDTLAQARALSAAELLLCAEDARAKLLAGDGDIELVVKLENLANRTIKQLGIANDGGLVDANYTMEMAIADVRAKEAVDQRQARRRR